MFIIPTIDIEDFVDDNVDLTLNSRNTKKSEVMKMLKLIYFNNQ